MNLNKVFILGNLTQDPDRRNLPSGQPVANFGVATNRFYTDKNGQKQQDAQFHNIVVFGKTAEIASQYLKKGSLVLIEGYLRTRNWQDQAGVRHYRTEIIAERLQLPPKGMSSGSGPFSAAAQSAARPSSIKEEDIPIIEEETTDDNQGNGPAETNNGVPEDEGEIDVKDIPF